MQPTQYNPATNFNQEETNAVAGRSTVRTAKLDDELTAISDSINEIIANLGVIQRDDTALRDAVVTVASLSSDVLSLIASGAFTVRGAWLTTTVYALGDVVSYLTGTYLCTVAHTAGTFATDLAAGKWGCIFNSAAIPASSVVFTPAGGIAAANVQSALEEVDTEAAKKAQNLADLSDAATALSNLLGVSRAEEQSQTYVYFVDSGSADALAITASPAISAYASGMRFTVKKSGSANATTAPTLNVNAKGAKKIFGRGGVTLPVGALQANGHYDFEYDASYDSAAGGWECKNPSNTSRAAGQCQLRYVSATSLKLYPCGGNVERINGVDHEIPAAGIASADPTAASNYVNGTANQQLGISTEYYVCLFDNAGTKTIGYWTKATGHNLDTTAGNIGIEVITGHPECTLEGWVKTNASRQFVNDATNGFFVRSWNNDYGIHANKTGAAGGFTRITWTTEVSMSVLLWNGESALCNASSSQHDTVGASTVNTAVSIGTPSTIQERTSSYTYGASYIIGTRATYNKVATSDAETLIIAAVYADGNGPYFDEGYLSVASKGRP